MNWQQHSKLQARRSPGPDESTRQGPGPPGDDRPTALTRVSGHSGARPHLPHAARAAGSSATNCECSVGYETRDKLDTHIEAYKVDNCAESATQAARPKMLMLVRLRFGGTVCC